MKIGFDLDGVIIDKPPVIPRQTLEWIIKNHSKQTLFYRYPGIFERFIRTCIHYPSLRPPIVKNLDLIKKLAKRKDSKLYVISGRYGFLKKRTDQWLTRHNIQQYFLKIYINKDNQQPHRFKKKTIEKLKIHKFIEDDEHIVSYLKKRLTNTKVILYVKDKTDLEKELLIR